MLEHAGVSSEKEEMKSCGRWLLNIQQSRLKLWFEGFSLLLTTRKMWVHQWHPNTVKALSHTGHSCSRNGWISFINVSIKAEELKSVLVKCTASYLNISGQVLFSCGNNGGSNGDRGCRMSVQRWESAELTHSYFYQGGRRRQTEWMVLGWCLSSAVGGSPGQVPLLSGEHVWLRGGSVTAIRTAALCWGESGFRRRL